MKFQNSKFYKFFNMIMEELSKDDEEYLDAATKEYLDTVSTIEDFKDLNKNEKINYKIQNVVKSSHFLADDKLIDFLESIGLNTVKHSEIFERITSAKDRFSNDWIRLIGKRNNKLDFTEFKESKSLNSIKDYYGFSDEFMKYLLNFEGKNNGQMGKGELLLACTIKNAFLPTSSIKINDKEDSEDGEVAGDIIINGKKYELKGSHAKIGDTMVQTSLFMKTIIAMIKTVILDNQEYLVNKEILPAFYAGRGNSVTLNSSQTVTGKRIKVRDIAMTGSFLNVREMPKIDMLFKEQFKYTELPDGKSDEKWWFYIKNNLLKQIFVKMFLTLYGEIGQKSIDENLNKLFYDDPTNLNVNIEEYKKVIFKTAMDWYSKYGKKFEEIIIIDPNGSNTVCCISATEQNYDRYINYFSYPTFGAKEGASRSDACVTGPTNVSILRNV